VRVLVCGDRWWRDRFMVRYVLSVLFKEAGLPFVVIEGGATGADQAAADWAKSMRQHGVEHAPVPAEWEVCGPWCPPTPHRRRNRAGKEFCPVAGVHRNMKQLKEEDPDLVVAFHGDLKSSKGTKHMVEISEKAGKEVWLLDGRGEKQ
jgi:hypothetical protein